jgi:hypothetical protein
MADKEQPDEGSFEPSEYLDAMEEGDEDFLLDKAVPSKRPRLSKLWKIGWALQGLLFLLSIIILIGATKVKPSDIQCAKQLSPYCK